MLERLQKSRYEMKKNGKMVMKNPFMISYSRYGKHAGFEGGKTLQDIQKKAQELRKKGLQLTKWVEINPVKKENEREG